MSDESNKIAFSTISQIVGRVFVLALTLLSIKLITNHLGPQGTGYYTTIITYFSFFIVIADFGLFSVAVRELAKGTHPQKDLLGNIFLIRLVSALITTLLACGIIFLTDYSNEIKYGILAASLFPLFNLAGSVYDMVLQTRLEMHKVALAEVISKIVALTGIWLATMANNSFYLIVATVSLAAVVNFAAKAVLSRRTLPFGLQYNREIAPAIIKAALPLGIVFIVNNIYFKIDTLLLFYLKGPSDVGIYSVAYRVLETTLFAGAYLSSSLKPLLSTTVHNDQERAGRAIITANVFLAFMGLLLAIICTVFPRDIILFLSNADFLGGAKALQLLGLAAIFIYVGGLFGEVMIARDMRKTMIKISLFVLVLNITLNLFLIPRYSYTGAAVTTLISEVILLALSFRAAARTLPLNLDYLRLGRLVAIAAISALFALYLKTLGLSFIIAIIATSILYCLLAYLTNTLPRRLIDDFVQSISPKW